MVPCLLSLTADQLPRQLAEVTAHLRQGVDASQWTRGWVAFAGLMPYFIEAQWPRVVAIQAARVQWPGQPSSDQRDLWARAFGGERLRDTQVRDGDSPGFVYFSSTHCMSCLQNERGQWWDVPQSSPTQVSPRRATELFQRATGVVAILSFRTVASLVRKHLTTAAATCPLLLARLAQRILRPRSPPATQAFVQAMVRTPRHTWTAAARAALRDVVTAWWSAAPP